MAPEPVTPGAYLWTDAFCDLLLSCHDCYETWWKDEKEKVCVVSPS